MNNEHHIQLVVKRTLWFPCTGAADTRTTKTQTLGVELSFIGRTIGGLLGKAVLI
jgi:hypothetical protein